MSGVKPKPGLHGEKKALFPLVGKMILQNSFHVYDSLKSFSLSS